MKLFKMFAGLKGETAFLALICVSIIVVIVILTIVKKLKDK